MRYTLLAASILATTSVAFKNTSPFLVWSSERDEALTGAQEEIKSGVIPADDIYSSLSSLGCDWKTLIVGHVEGLHNSRVNALRLPSDTADLRIPYLVRPSKSGLDEAIDEWTATCSQGQVIGGTDSDKNVINVDLASDQDVESLLKDAESPYILIVTGSHAGATRSKRQEEEVPLPSETDSDDEPSPSPSSSPSSSPNDDDTKVNGPLLERVQLLTTPIITGLLITFGLLLPILYIGISALAGIQVPPRMLEIGKSTHVGKDRKDQ